MTEQLKVTNAEEIAALSQTAFEQDAKDTGELVKLPKTGIVARLRRADIEGDALTGGLPLSLVAAAMGEQGGEEREMTPEQIKDSTRGLIFMRQTVLENCLEPQIGYDEAGRVSFMVDGKPVGRVHKIDFMFAFQWITGQEAREQLNSFRNRQTRRATTSSAGRKKLRAATERDAVSTDSEQPVTA